MALSFLWKVFSLFLLDCSLPGLERSLTHLCDHLSPEASSENPCMFLECSLHVGPFSTANFNHLDLPGLSSLSPQLWEMTAWVSLLFLTAQKLSYGAGPLLGLVDWFTVSGGHPFSLPDVRCLSNSYFILIIDIVWISNVSQSPMLWRLALLEADGPFKKVGHTGGSSGHCRESLEGDCGALTLPTSLVCFSASSFCSPHTPVPDKSWFKDRNL